MADPIIFNVQAFQPFSGGRGKRLTVTTSSATGAIPGGQQDAIDRVLVTNGGNVSAFVCLGPSTVAATLDCQEIMPGTQVLLGTPFPAPSGLYIAAITESGSTKVQATAGRGT
jgi:hypothetical protein